MMLTVVWMVSILHLISDFPSFLSKALRIVPISPTITSMTVILMYRRFFSSLTRSKYSISWRSFIVTGTAKSTRSFLLVRIEWFVYIPKSHRILWVSFSRTDSDLSLWLNSKFLEQFPVNHLSHPVLPCLVLLLCQFAASHVIKHFISVST